MRGVLLDTNALLWVLTGSEHLGEATRRRLSDTAPVYLSSVSVLEIAIKEMLGRLAVPGDPAQGARRAGLIELPFSAQHAAGLKEFPMLARHDPFDRMLLSQASRDELFLVTSDRVLLTLGFDWVLDARE